MPIDYSLKLHDEVGDALMHHHPVVVLESSLIAQGLPWPANLETARAAQQAIRNAGAAPATVAVVAGRIHVGLDDSQLESLANGKDIIKAGQGDLAAAVVHGTTAATTVSATLAIAHQAGIRFFATGGIGGAHRGAPEDVSADLYALSRHPVAVVCSGAKCILDIPRTLEILESLGVPVVGYGTNDFPGFYMAASGEGTAGRVDSPQQAAELVRIHWHLGGAGVVVANPIPAHNAVDPKVFQEALVQAEREASEAGIRGKALTPFLLERIAGRTNGETVRANQALVIANASLAAEAAKAYVIPTIM